MCRTIHALLTVVICGVQMLVRVFMTMILMIENVIRMFLQTLYNFISFLLQLISLIPICCVFFATSRLKCFMCGGGGPCPVRRGGGCDCLMSAVAIIILFFIFRATGVLDKIFYSIGYAKAAKHIVKFSPTPGTITECSRNDTLLVNATTLQQKPNMVSTTSNNDLETTEIQQKPNVVTTTANNDLETTEIQQKPNVVTTTASNDPETTEIIDDTPEIKDTTPATTTTAKIPQATTTILTISPATTTIAKIYESTTQVRNEQIANTTTVERRMGNEKPLGNSLNDDDDQIIDPETNSTQTDYDTRIIDDAHTNNTQTDEVTQFIEDDQRNNNQTNEDIQTIIFYYDTQISGDNSTAITKTVNNESLETEHEGEDDNLAESETRKPTKYIKPDNSNSKFSMRATRSAYDRNYHKSKLKEFLGTPISYYMV